MSTLFRKFAQSFLPGIVRPLHSLWNEVLGALFLCFAILLVRPVYKAYQDIAIDPAHFIKFLLSLFFCAIMFFFGIQAFWRARRISRGK